MKDRERQILALIREDPMIPQQAIAERLGISRPAVAGYIMKLTARGVIKGRGYVFSDQPFVVAIGGANLDIHGRPAAPIRESDSNPGSVHSSPGGVARNVAENLARLGVDCRLVSAVGHDQPGDMLIRLGRAAGIDMRHVLRSDRGPTSTYVSVLDENGELQLAISDMRVVDELGPEQLQGLEAMLKQAALIVLDTNLGEAALAWLTDTLRDRTIFVDTVSGTKASRIRPYLQAVHTLAPSAREAESLTGLPARTARQLPRVAQWCHDRGVERVFVTLGKRGVFYSSAESQGIVPPLANRRKSNTGGAGDAFLAGLAYSWLERLGLEASLRFGLAAASITLGGDGSSSPMLSLSAIRRQLGESRVA